MFSKVYCAWGVVCTWEPEQFGFKQMAAIDAWGDLGSDVDAVDAAATINVWDSDVEDVEDNEVPIDVWARLGDGDADAAACGASPREPAAEDHTAVTAVIPFSDSSRVTDRVPSEPRATQSSESASSSWKPSCIELTKWKAGTVLPRMRYPMPKVSERTVADKHLLANRMREAKAKRREIVVKSYLAQCAEALLKRSLRKKKSIFTGALRKSFLKNFKALLQVEHHARHSTNQGSGGHLAAGTELKIAFTPMVRASDVAIANGVALPTVRRCQILVAHSREHLCKEQLTTLKAAAAAKQPLCIWVGHKYDHAKIWLRTKMRDSIATSATDIMVCRTLVCTIWEDDASVFDLIEAPRACTDTSAGAVYDGLYRLEPQRSRCKVLDDIAQRSLLSGHCHGGDGAYGNEKFAAGLSQKKYAEKSKDLDTSSHCGNHANHLIEECQTLIMGKSPIKKVASFSILLRSSGYFSRARACVPELMRMRCVVVKGDPPPEARAFATCVKDHLIFLRFLFKKALSKDCSKEVASLNKRSEAFSNAFEDFVALFNGFLPESESLIHYSGDNDVPVEVVQKLGVEVTNKLLFAAAIPKPEDGKWTKTGPAVDGAVLAGLAKGIVLGCVKLGLGPLKLEEEVTASGNVKFQELTFRQASGVRCQDTLVLLSGDKDFETLLMFWIVNKAVRYITAYFLKRSSEFLDPDLRPAALDLSNLEFSPAAMVRQWLSALLAGCVPELRILWATFGHSSWEDYCHQRPAAAANFRALVRNTDAWVDRRFVRAYTERVEWTVYNIVDKELGVASRLAACDEVCSANLCCGGFFIKGLQEKVGNPSDFLHPHWQRALWGHACVRSWALTIADLERRNKRSKTIASDKGISFLHLAACHANVEAKQISEVDQHMKLLEQKRLDKPLPPPPKRGTKDIGAEARKSKPKRRRTAFAFFQKDLAAIRKAQGQACEWWEELPEETRSQRMKRYMQVTKDLFEQLSENERQVYLCKELADAAESGAGPSTPAPAEAVCKDVAFNIGHNWSGARRCDLEKQLRLPSTTEFGKMQGDSDDFVLSVPQFLCGISKFRTKKACTTKYETTHGEFATDRSELPTHIRHYRPCAIGRCRSSIDTGCKKMASSTTKAMVQLKRLYKSSIQQLGNHEVLVSLELTTPSREIAAGTATRLVGVGFVSAISGLSGHHHETFTMHLLGCSHDVSGTPSPLFQDCARLHFRPLVATGFQSKRRSADHFNNHGHGQQKTLMEDDLVQALQSVMALDPVEREELFLDGVESSACTFFVSFSPHRPLLTPKPCPVSCLRRVASARS